MCTSIVCQLARQHPMVAQTEQRLNPPAPQPYRINIFRFYLSDPVTRNALPDHLPARIFSGQQRGDFVAHADAQLHIIAWALRSPIGE